jgi:hypothetical protein
MQRIAERSILKGRVPQAKSLQSVALRRNTDSGIIESTLTSPDAGGIKGDQVLTRLIDGLNIDRL